MIRSHRQLHTMTHSPEVGWRCPHRRGDLLTTARAALLLCLAVLAGYSAPVYAGQTFDEMLENLRLWPDGEVPFRLSETFTPIERFTIAKALFTWKSQTHSAVRFILVTGPTVPKKHLHILTPEEFNGLTWPNRGRREEVKGCGAWGPQTSGVTYLWLARPDCINEPTVLHEVGHTIGLGHEHLRLDRDLYMTIGTPPSPDSDSPEESEESPVGFFDYRSIMHSHPVLAVSQPKSRSISPWTPPSALSEGDVDTIRALYAFEVRRHTDIPGGDYANFPLLRDTQRACQLACAADVRCTAYTYVGRGREALDGNNPAPHCFLKGDGRPIPAFQSRPDRYIHSGKRKPGQLGSFGAARDVDLFGGQISGGVVAMPNNVLNGANCKDLCVSDSKCDAFTFAPAEMSGTCFKKSHKPDVPGEPPFSYQRRKGFLSGVVRPP